MFPHVITIYRHSVENGADKYRRQTVRDVYWYGRRGVTISGKGLQAANFVTVVSSPEQAAAFGTSWNVILGDRLIRGEGSDDSADSENPHPALVLFCGPVRPVSGLFFHGTAGLEHRCPDSVSRDCRILGGQRRL